MVRVMKVLFENILNLARSSLRYHSLQMARGGEWPAAEPGAGAGHGGGCRGHGRGGGLVRPPGQGGQARDPHRRHSGGVRVQKC